MNYTQIRQLCNEYITYCRLVRGLRPQTIINYENGLALFCKLMPEITTCDAITVPSVSAFFERLQVRKRVIGRGEIVQAVKKSTIEAYWNKLHPFFDWLVARGQLEFNPLRKLVKPKPDYTDRRKLIKTDVERIITAIETNAKNTLTLKRDRTIFYILLFCGLRKSELLGLQIRDVNLEKKILVVRGETSKSKRTRTIPINPILAVHLKDYLDERTKTGYTTPYLIVSTTRDNKFSLGGMKHWVERFRAVSGVRFHVHQFRHTFACNLGAGNTSAVKIQKLMGHNDLRMTQRYLRSMDVEDLREEVNSLSIDSLR